MAPFLLCRRLGMELSELFKWKQELPIYDAKGNEVLVRTKPLVVHQKVLGDFDINVARKEALKASRAMRIDLKLATSDSSMALMPDYADADDDTLTNMIVLSEAFEMRRKASSDAKKPKEPRKPGTDATLEEQETYEAAMAEYPAAIAKALDDHVSILIKKRLEALKKFNRKDLESLFVSAVTESLCQAEMLRAFNDWCAYLGTYTDSKCTERAFKSFDEYVNASTELKAQLIMGYTRLEMGGENLKN